MARIFKAPNFPLPEIDYRKSVKENKEQEDAYINNLVEFLKKRKPNDKLVGEEIRFPVADGYARYIVASSKGKVDLIHLELGDAWHFEYAHKLTKKDIVKIIKQQKAIKKIFG
ncbi:MAG: hypothetical protein KatS3mg035_1032 [Bacteroidia bacterium]|nr:MAG: hypothetical protein KatS3mg035_1032 [Bacteroidia bacterium]